MLPSLSPVETGLGFAVGGRRDWVELRHTCWVYPPVLGWEWRVTTTAPCLGGHGRRSEASGGEKSEGGDVVFVLLCSALVFCLPVLLFGLGVGTDNQRASPGTGTTRLHRLRAGANPWCAYKPSRKLTHTTLFAGESKSGMCGERFRRGVGRVCGWIVLVALHRFTV
jgi:hypothetical protein